ncbi:MAG TPA: hypothetical protein VLQ52_04080 [Coriobacteriia bacterium]|nr:hypothetical protein [Coriobacteriia bacterium]
MAELCRYASECPVCIGSLGLGAARTRRYRTGYCLDDWRECARFAVAGEAGPDAVPRDLLPTDHTRAYGIVSSTWLEAARTPAAAVFGAR